MDAAFRPVVLGVAGGSGAGKSTVVREVCRRLEPGIACVLHHDAYYRDLAHLDAEERAGVNFDHPDSLETGLLVEHVKCLLVGEAVEVPTYDFSTHTRGSVTERREPAPVIVLDGVLVLADARLRDLMDLKVFVDAELESRLRRRIRRDVTARGRTPDSVIAQFDDTVHPMHVEFVEPTRRYADLVVQEGGFNRPAVERVVARLRALVEERRAQARGFV